MINKLSNIDMKPLYREILCYYDEFPEFIVLDELEDGSLINCRLLLSGRYIYYLKNDPNMAKTFMHELKDPSCKVFRGESFENHCMEGSDIAKWTSFTCVVADLLNIRCPQIIFTKDRDAGNAAGEGLMIIPDSYSDIDLFVCIAHELRHEWQIVNHPKWNDDYIQVNSADDLSSYYNHISEIDAEAFARKLASIVFDMDILNVDLHNGENKKAIIKRAAEITIDLSDDVLEYLYGFVDIERFFNYGE